MTRCEQGKKKNVYLCSPAVRDLISANQERVKVINSGVKVFARCDNKQTPCGFRLAQEVQTEEGGWLSRYRRRMGGGRPPDGTRRVKPVPVTGELLALSLQLGLSSVIFVFFTHTVSPLPTI